MQALKSFNYDFKTTKAYKDTHAGQLKESNIIVSRQLMVYTKVVLIKKRKKLSTKRT
jgi:hypothetical protein